MKCNKCGFDNQEDSVFCSKCGTRLATTCPNCGKPISADSYFCSYCGENLSMNSAEHFQTKKPIEKQSKSQNFLSPKVVKANARLIISVICILVAISMLILGFSYVNNNYNHPSKGIEVVFFIGFVIFSIGGIFVYNPAFFTKQKNVRLSIMVIGILFFLYGVICAGYTWYGIEWDNIDIYFIFGLLMLLLGLVPFIWSFRKGIKCKISWLISKISCRRVSSVLLTIFSLLLIIGRLTIPYGAMGLSDVFIITFLGAFVILGILGFNAKKSIYGTIVVIIATIGFLVFMFDLFHSIYFNFYVLPETNQFMGYAYLDSLKKTYYSAFIMFGLIYIMILVLGILMRINPKYLQHSSESDNSKA